MLFIQPAPDVLEPLINAVERLSPCAVIVAWRMASRLFPVCVENGSQIYFDIARTIVLDEIVQALKCEVAVRAAQAHHSLRTCRRVGGLRVVIRILARPLRMLLISRRLRPDSRKWNPKS